jgi:hypothetical protein
MQEERAAFACWPEMHPFGRVTPVIDFEEALRRAQAAVDSMSPLDLPLVLCGHQDFEVGWVFFYDSRMHQETGDDRYLIAGNAPILVDRESGDVEITGTAKPIEHYVGEYVERRRRRLEGWPHAIDRGLQDLLALVREGGGERDTRSLDIYARQRHIDRTAHTIDEQLAELQRRGLVMSKTNAAGHRSWAITPAGDHALGSART